MNVTFQCKSLNISSAPGPEILVEAVMEKIHLWMGTGEVFLYIWAKKKGSKISVMSVKYGQPPPSLIVIIQYVLKKINSSPSVQTERAVLVLYWFPCHFTSRWEDSALAWTPILHVLLTGHPSFSFADPSSPFNPPRLSRAFVLTPPGDGASNVSQTGGPSADRL